MWVICALQLLAGVQAIKKLTSISVPKDKSSLPKLSLIFAARNEASTLCEAVQSMLSIDYPDFEVIAINDRSTDETGTILEEMAKTDRRLRPMHIQPLSPDFLGEIKKPTLIRSLPPNWLGKVNALHQGAETARGKWILFTDADIYFEHSALVRAVSHAESERLDHLTILPRLEESTHLLGVCLNMLMTLSMVFLKPWRAIKKDHPTYYCGLGAFNMVLATSYRSRGGHSNIHMRPDDDIMLGKLMKSQNGRSEYMFSDGLIWCTWYETVSQLIGGLSKNTYASVEYSPLITLISSLIHFFTFVCPLVGWWWSSSLNFGVAFVLQLVVTATVTTKIRGSLKYVPFTPLGALVIIYIMLRTMVVTHYHQGIYWRDTFYSLTQLKQSIVVS
jgi:glycosyltransferase involved in cell wall biosynthesis